MTTITLSPKFQVAIPKKLREKLRLRPGQQLQVIAYEDRIELIPVIPLSEMRGFLKGLDPRVSREDDRL